MPSEPSANGNLIYSLVLRLRPTHEAPLAPTQGYRAYALLLQMLHCRDEALSREIHDMPGPKPLTVSPLRGPLRRNGEGRAVSADADYSLRLTVLSEGLFARIIDCLFCLPADQELRLDTATFVLDGVLTTPVQSELAGFSSFTTLLAQARPSKRLRIAFDSPTAFRSGGQRNVALPLPGLVFGSLLTRWNQLAPEPLPEQLRTIAADGLLVADYRVETRMLDFGAYREVGFEGECEYECAPDTPLTAAAQLSALADYAFFSGIGAKTSMGMGQARRIATRGDSVSRRAGIHPAQAR